MAHPDWALKHKVKGTELRKIGKYYYLYKSAIYGIRKRNNQKKSLVSILVKLLKKAFQ